MFRKPNERALPMRQLALAVALGVGAVAVSGALVVTDQAAWAQSESGNGQGNQGSQQGQDNQGDQGQGQGGPSADSDGKGPQAGAPSGSSGGKPVWAQEGIPEVELGRLNVARSPDHVLQAALLEAIATSTSDIVAFYNLSLDEAITELSLNFDSVVMYDSPLQSLALLEDVLVDGQTSLTGVTNDTETLAALFLGTASDKTLPITTDTVIAVTTILGTPITGDAAEQLAADAEAVRIAILAGHG